MALKRTTSARLKKITAAFLLLSLLNQLIAPAAAWALTSGPTAPEATSFEPVDTTDMVNLLTGDLVYNLPLLEVPGPEGGYPLSLSYHAGIQPNEDASWVGLGWTLNPGAINRSVNGFPDDWYGAESSRRDFWEGGTRTGSRVGVSVPILGNMANVSFGLSFSNDTYEGHGVGWDIGFGTGIPNTPLSAGAGIGMSTTGRFYGNGSIGGEYGPFSAGLGFGINQSGNLYASANIGVSGGKGIYETGAGLNVFADFSGISTGFYAENRLMALGVSLSSNSAPSFSIGGVTASTQNSRAGAISTHTKSISVNLILASYNRYKTRYWSNEIESSYMYGALYPSWILYNEIPDDMAFDAYNLQEDGKSIVDDPDPNRQQGGAFPSYDIYQVTAQGLGGAIRPYRYEGESHQQNRWEMIDDQTAVKTVGYISNSNAFNDPAFRFENDFSNNYIQTYPDFPFLGSELIFYSPPNSGPLFDEQEWMNGYNGGELAGSKYITYFVTKWDGTVSEYGNGKKFIKPVVKGLNRRAHTYQADAATHIAGFSVTNESGVSYHYNLPAYSYDEEMYQENFDRMGKLKFNRQVRTEGYAYTWYLTAITGPDYVDRGVPGVVDEQDYGQWISFEYGKWSDKYAWRNPSEGYHKDDDNQFRTVSMGKREVYYLNAIRTRSHVALFEKDVRYDAKGCSPEIFNKNWAGSPINVETDYQNEGVFNINSSQSMRLDRIYLLNKSSEIFFATTSTGGPGDYVPSGRSISCTDCELYNNVLDKNDVNVAGRLFLERMAIRIIDFNYDYSLAKGTANSYNINNPSSKFGKLTLTNIKFRGNGGADLLPPVDFEYGPDPLYNKSVSGSLSSNVFVHTDDVFEVGDMLETDTNTPIYCGVIVSKNKVNTNTWHYILKNSDFSSSGTWTVRTTKNPPYNKDKYDAWGMYKSDYTLSPNENLSRLTTPVSNRGADVWSLRRIKTGLGANIRINYEGDTYGRSVLSRSHSLIVSNFTNQGGGNFYFTVDPGGYNISDFFKIGDEIDIMLLKEINGTSFSTISSKMYSSSPKITALSGNYIYVKCPDAINNDILYSGGSGSIKTGNLKVYNNHVFYGGGIRVSSIMIDDLAGVVNVTRYGYNDLSGIYSSGITTYEPVNLDVDNVSQSISSTDANVIAEAVKVYKRVLYKEFSRLLTISREVPPPGVMYEYVTVSKDVINAPDHIISPMFGKSLFQFEVFRENMIGKQNVTPPRSSQRDAYSAYYTRNIVLQKFISNIGALRRYIVYEVNPDQNRESKQSETIYHYLHDGLENLPYVDFMAAYEQRLSQYKKQGLIKERYSEVKSVWTRNDSHWDIKATLNAREEYPAIKTGQTVIDYVSGLRKSTVNLSFDFYSGAVTKQVSTDAYGNRFMQEMVPAYRKYSEMGLKTTNSLNKNMLNQETVNYSYKVDNSNNVLGLVSATVQLWGTGTPVHDMNRSTIVQNDEAVNGKIWRKTESYSWMPSGQSRDGMTAIVNFPDFNWLSVTQNEFWKKTGAITLYDVFSKPLQFTDINGLISAKKMDYNNSKVVVEGSNTAFSQLAYSGAEEESSGEVNFQDGIANGVMSHTGTMALQINPGKRGFSYTIPLSDAFVRGKDYYASVWVSPGSDFITGIPGASLYYKVGTYSGEITTSQKKARRWFLLELKIPASQVTDPNAILTIGCANSNEIYPMYFDDFRVQPLNALVSSYVYDRFTGELNYILDNNNLFTKMEYDKAGRLTRVYKEVLGKTTLPLVKEVMHNYQKVNN